MPNIYKFHDLFLGLELPYFISFFEALECLLTSEMNLFPQETFSVENIWIRRDNLFLPSLSLDFLEIAFRISLPARVAADILLTGGRERVVPLTSEHFHQLTFSLATIIKYTYYLPCDIGNAHPNLLL